MNDIVEILEDGASELSYSERLQAALEIRRLRKEVARLSEVAANNLERGMG